MRSKFLLHATLIIASSLLPFLWSQSSITSNYTLQLCGALIILYTALRKFLPHTNNNVDPNILTILTANSITQLLVFSTGGTSSPLFFLYYFLIFAFAMIYEGYQAVTISLITVAIYLIKTGEETGKLSEMLLTVARNYEADSQELVDKLTGALSPIMLVVMAFVVGFIVLAIAPVIVPG